MRSTNGHHCGEDAAAYVLGALEPAEADAFRRHIADCPDCREEVAAFEQVTGALPQASAQHAVPRELRRRVMSDVRASPKAAAPRRPGLSVGRGPLVAFAAAAVAVIVAVALTTSGSSGTRVIQASVGSAQLRIAGGHGDLVIRRLPPPSTGRIYEMWVQRGQATPTPTGTLFTTTSRGTAAVGVPGSLNGVSAVMVSQEPAGGSPAPTSAPVVVARLT